MKKLLLIGIIFLGSISLGFSQVTVFELEEVDLPQEVKISFAKNAIKKSVEWTLEEGNTYIASFYDDIQMIFVSIYYAQNGAWIKTSTELDEYDLPTEVAQGILTQYDDYTISDIYEDIFDDKIEYRIQIEALEEFVFLVINETGTIISQIISSKDY